MKLYLPTVLLVVFSVSFMNSRIVAAAGMFGMLTLLAIAWLIVRQQNVHRSAGELLF